MSELYDAPNQQVVRADGSGPWEEGTGGESEEDTGGESDVVQPVDLDAMTKDELLAYAQQLDVSPANAAMTKDELRAGIDAKEAGQ
jgi:hypothetical protein